MQVDVVEYGKIRVLDVSPSHASVKLDQRAEAVKSEIQ